MNEYAVKVLLHQMNIGELRFLKKKKSVAKDHNNRLKGIYIYTISIDLKRSIELKKNIKLKFSNHSILKK